jgi:sensor histidine kinase YesM
MQKANQGKPVNRFLRVVRDLLILIVIGNGMVFFMEPDLRWNLLIFLTNCAFSIGIGYPSWKGIAYVFSLLDKRVPWLKSPIKRLVLQVVLLILLSLIVIIIAAFIWLLISEEVTFRNVGDSAIKNLEIIVPFLLLTLVITNGVQFFIKWRQAAIREEELKRAHLALQYQSLKDQLRPHFLFNSLSSLVTLIGRDQEKATQFVHRLSDVYRYVLDQTENELVPVGDELKFLEDYVFLQKIRYGENLQVIINLHLEKNLMVIPLSLQMMVENAIKHNVVSAEHPLTVDLQSDEKDRIVIRNNIHRKRDMEGSPGLGLNNLRKRISVFSDDPLRVEETPGSFTVIIPTIQT